MPLSATVLSAGIIGIFGTVAGSIVVFDPVNAYRYPSEEGAMYLRHYYGYKNVQEVHGESKSCGNLYHRHYSAEDADGQWKRSTEVCFNKIFRAHLPRP